MFCIHGCSHNAGTEVSETRRFEVDPRRSYVAKVFVLLDSTVICSLYKLTLAHQSQVTLHLTASLCYFL